VRHHAPGAATTDNIQYCIHDIPKCPCPRPPASVLPLRQEWRNQRPLGIIQVGWVGLSVHTYKFTQPFSKHSLRFHCRRCQSVNVVKNGKNSAGNQQFLCKDCGKSAVMYPSHQRSAEEQEQILATYRERPSMRGVARVYHISRNTLKEMLQKK